MLLKRALVRLAVSVPVLNLACGVLLERALVRLAVSVPVFLRFGVLLERAFLPGLRIWRAA